MLELKLDLSSFERYAAGMRAAIDQVPFALSKAMNDAAFAARKHLIDDTWPKHVQQRNRNFLRAALRVEPAKKTDLRVAIVDQLGRGHLQLHAKGGVKQAKGRLAVPSKRVQRGPGGVRQSQRPRNLKRAVVKGNLIFQQEGRGKSAKLRLMYALRQQAKIRKRVPFYEDFATVMRREILQRFPGAMAQAMRTRR
jgi:hypothetical protein